MSLRRCSAADASAVAALVAAAAWCALFDDGWCLLQQGFCRVARFATAHGLVLVLMLSTAQHSMRCRLPSCATDCLAAGSQTGEELALGTGQPDKDHKQSV